MFLHYHVDAILSSDKMKVLSVQQRLSMRKLSQLDSYIFKWKCHILFIPRFLVSALTVINNILIRYYYSGINLNLNDNSTLIWNMNARNDKFYINIQVAHQAVILSSLMQRYTSRANI